MSITNKKQEIDTTPAPIQQRDRKDSQHAYSSHSITVPRKMTAQELEQSALYSNIAARMGLRDRVEIQSADGTMLALGLITSHVGGEVKVKIYELYDMGDIIQEEIDFMGYLIRLNPISSQWAIVNKKSGDTLKDEIPSQKDAITYLTDHLKSSK